MAATKFGECDVKRERPGPMDNRCDSASSPLSRSRRSSFRASKGERGLLRIPLAVRSGLMRAIDMQWQSSAATDSPRAIATYSNLFYSLIQVRLSEDCQRHVISS